ncbi:TPA: STAS-like domain-containing protein [Klebsiella pneumoniae subsp. pneumoniae]|uniref:STAS-like domain-containing protein n=1 Tax=Klebsiella pneumoniae TaxID=573 RepID=UPI003301BE2F|nr:STAS-like domain-containing protein [Klebsiella pneumoniae subsp. pneumoniae]HBQ5736973.1 STAS-like domain-containing protein [Klebsiella pneumoniae subsp. pneumoniae]HBQ5747322.1 STAS-like domain-containing protein [Klebsiella pneumoniae subsp. pneumoniae]HBQ6002729.1 STAS-like domain-containing protein [Klebsiella pneumoniae subsp. pneumoniae]
MNRIAYKLPEGDLASRNQAIPQRHHIEVLIKSGNAVDLDLSGVYSISESYSDEIFGVLVVKFGVTKILNQVKVRNASPSILKSIAKVIQRRSNEVATKKAQSVGFNGVCAAC